MRKIWIPTTEVHVLPKNSYQVCTANGTIYCHTRCHLWECSLKYNNAEPEAPSATLATLGQAHTRFPRSVSQPATTTQQKSQLVETCNLRTKPCCPSFYTYSHPPLHHISTYAIMTVRPCPYSTKTPDHRGDNEEVTTPVSINGVLDLECPWTILVICALSCLTIILAQAL